MKTILITLAVSLITFLSSAQLRGSGETITKNYDYQNFNKVYFEDLDGKIEVEAGKTFSVSVTIDDNLINLLSVVEHADDKTLTISLKGNKNNKMYIEDTKISVKVTLPNVVGLKNDSNASMTVTGIIGNYLKIETLDNGSSTVTGKIENLDVTNSGNGVLNAKQLLAKNAKIRASGNGNVYINVSQLISAKTSGNCTVINLGKAKFGIESSSSGNSRYVNN
jgi:hypothetical protein